MNNTLIQTSLCKILVSDSLLRKERILWSKKRKWQHAPCHSPFRCYFVSTFFLRTFYKL